MSLSNRGQVQGITMNIDHRIRNEQISLKSLDTTTSPGIDKNHSRGAFCTSAGGTPHTRDLIGICL